MLISVNMYFEILFNDRFTVKPASEKDEPLNNADQKILYLDYKTLKADGGVDILPAFHMQVFQLKNKKAINKIDYNDKTRMIKVSYIDQNFFVSIKQIEKIVSRSDEAEFCATLEDVLNEILKLPE